MSDGNDGKAAESRRETIQRAVDEQRARATAASAKTTTAKISDIWEAADKSVFGLCEVLALLFALPFGDDIYQDRPTTAWHVFYLLVGCLFAAGGPMFPLIRKWPGLAEKLASAARDVRIWIAVLLLFFAYNALPEIYQRATAPQRRLPSAEEIADAVASKLPLNRLEAPAPIPTLVSAFPLRSASDADKEIPVLDAVFAVMRDAQPLEMEGRRLSGSWIDALQNDATITRYDDDLAAFRANLTGMYAKLLAIKDSSPQYFDDDMSRIVDKVDFDSIRRSFDDFVGAWTALKSIVDVKKPRPGDIERLMSLHGLSLENSMTVYHDWIYNSKEALLNRRKQLSAIAGRQQ